MQPILVRSLAEHAYLREHLLAEFRETIDEETLRDTLEGLSSLPEALAAVVRSYLDDLMVAAALGMRIGDMQERLSRIEARVEKKRASITVVMEKGDIKKLEQPDFTASLRAVPPGLVVADEALIPTGYWEPVLALLLSTAACAQYGQTASVAPGSVPVYQRSMDAQLPMDQQVAALQSAEDGCVNQVDPSVVAQDAMPQIPGGPDAEMHRQLAIQDSPAASAVGDADFDACMHSLGYQRAQ